MSDDDFFIEDVIKNLGDKKKKINSKDKGRRGESDLCKVLSARFKDKPGFFRTVGSGNRWYHATLTEQAKQVLTGDIVCAEGFAFSIECKYGYADIDLSSAFDNGSKQLDEFLAQAEKDANRVSKKPMLCWKKPRQGWLACLKSQDAPCRDFNYKMYYREWVILSLTEILTEPDGFFFT